MTSTSSHGSCEMEPSKSWHEAALHSIVRRLCIHSSSFPRLLLARASLCCGMLSAALQPLPWPLRLPGRSTQKHEQAGSAAASADVGDHKTQGSKDWDVRCSSHSRSFELKRDAHGGLFEILLFDIPISRRG
mmetsp:Transcript_126865/g.224852  ORF Transcript_126865/g.224852 Transcript_126865/m.224852 type:complete len:132 (-) Transcript_126865:51-446(-)